MRILVIGISGGYEDRVPLEDMEFFIRDGCLYICEQFRSHNPCHVYAKGFWKYCFEENE